MPLNLLILRVLSVGRRQQVELRQQTGSPAQTTLRAQLKRLHEIGVIDKQRRNRFPGVLEYELTGAGRDLLFVADVTENWLVNAPEGPLKLGGNAAKAAVKALTEAWSTTMVRALAAGPLSLTDLDRVIGALSYPALERRLAALRFAGLIVARPGNGRGTPYAVTDWLRQGIAPLCAAARWERRHMPRDTTTVGRLDVEAAFLLTVPALRRIEGQHGTCRLAAELANGKERRLAGVVVGVEDGAITSCATNLEESTEAWALGPSAAWLNALVGGDMGDLELGGDSALARALIERLHEALFSTNRPLALDSDRSIEEDRAN